VTYLFELENSITDINNHNTYGYYMNRAIQMYGGAKRRLESEGHSIAPVETATTDTKEENNILETH
jgi:hypothetical protein